ncbi:MAG: DUF2357 domain-containing protein, partial [Candidatus Hydrothermia bacterium]
MLGAEWYDLLWDLCLMTNRLAIFSKRAAKLKLEERRKPTSLAKLMFFRVYFKRFASITEEMISRPRKAIIRERKPVLSARLSSVDAAVLVNAVKAGYGGSSKTFPETVTAHVRTTTTDTYEMRFLLWFVNRLVNYLNWAIPEVDSAEKRGESIALFVSTEELTRHRYRLLWLMESLEDMGIEPLDYPENPPLSFVSHPVYSEMWRLFRRFEGMIMPKGLNESLTLARWRFLYEFWCFLSIAEYLEAKWEEESEERLWDTENLETAIREDEHFSLAAKTDSVMLYYQKHFPYYTQS